jgi:hypothetical protein
MSMPDAKAIFNADYLGRTYDVVKMDPLNLGGSSTKQNAFVLDLTEEDKDLSGDTYWIIPKGTLHTMPLSQNWETASTTMSSSSEFQQQLKVAVEVDAGVEGGFEFSGSASSSKMEDVTQSRKRTYVYSRYYIENHTLDFDLSDRNAPLELKPEFRAAVLALPYQDEVSDWEAQYAEFIATWGTHFTKGIVLGGLAAQRTSGLATTYLKSTDSEETLKSKASVQYEAIKGGASAEAAQSLATKTDNDYSLERVTLDFRGGQGSPSSITDQWVTSVTDYPAIVKANLERLSYLLTPRFFPDQDYIDELQSTLDLAITDWIQTKGRACSDTAPVRYGEPVVMVMPWQDGKTQQIAVLEGNVPHYPIQFPIGNADRKPDYSSPTAALRILSNDGSNKGGVILAGDQIRIEVIDKGFVNRDGDVTTNSADAGRFTLLHYDDNPSAPGRIGEYFQGSDVIRILPAGATDDALGISSQREFRRSGNVSITGFRLVRCAEQDES